ncbi:acyl-CoA synthetase [Thalassorhabdomicrobium marinisediminis]|uniref:Acyl-CoA synthetase n=1 Tax=Thalassorhabdomicrobium marinisediminis TaxID=2170577 RepID=A0A2T7FTK5_9RHOB|nr:acyl-CoA synthetase [Thalassorhabdomicrobium marinisediminis]PVA05496.1 acyl-CoA synthetase [Thalassorhabdomicrobium marinisediminis]
MSFPVSTRVMNLAHFLSESARRHPDAIGLVWGQKTWNWAELEARATAFAAALRDRYGMTKGDRLLVQSTNCNQMFEAAFACWKLGCVWVPANFRQTPEDVAWLAQSSGAKGLLAGAEFAAHIEACDGVDFAVTIGGEPSADDYDALVAAHAEASVTPAEVERDDPAWFFFTSGTTGKPKAAVLTHGQLAFVVTNHLCDLMPGTGPDDASIVVAPLSHGAGVHQLAQVARGAKTILPGGTRFDPDEVWRLVQDWRVTNAFTVPTIVKMLVEHPSVHEYDHSSLRYVVYAGAPMYRADQVRALEVLGPVLVQYFGLGEVTGNITVLPPAQHSADDSAMRIGTCGVARTGMQVQVQDAEGNEVPVGETGEVAVIGPAVFAGYHDNPEANAKAFRNGWFLTGDLGHMDAEGFLYLTDRASDMYISGGSNIYPRELEEKILTHPQIAECAVLGVPDRDWGEVGVAVCVPRDSAPEAAALLEWLGAKVPRYKLPKRVLFWDALPKSGYGKITKKLIRAELAARGEIADV